MCQIDGGMGWESGSAGRIAGAVEFDNVSGSQGLRRAGNGTGGNWQSQSQCPRVPFLIRQKHRERVRFQAPSSLSNVRILPGSRASGKRSAPGLPGGVSRGANSNTLICLFAPEGIQANAAGIPLR